MKLVEQILRELGADGLNGITLVPGRCCYLKSVKSVINISEESIILAVGKNRVEISGGELEVGEYFEGDVIIKGDVRAVKVE